MEYLLVMSFSGSVMVGIYMLLRYSTNNKISARLQYQLARAAILYYLIPLPFVKKWYDKIIMRVFPYQTTKIVKVSPRWDYYVIETNEKLYFNSYTRTQAAIITVWILIALGLLAIELFDYLQTRQLLTCCMNKTRIDGDDSFKRLKEQCGLKRKIIVYQGQNEERTMTFGFLKPVILCGHKMGSKEAALILRHELIHIRRWDTIWKMLRRFVIFLHWWNPVAWILYLDFSQVCEWSCDEVTVLGKTKEEVKEYVRLLIYESMKEKDEGKSRLQWSVSFGSGAKRLKKRMDNIMKMKKWNKITTGIIVIGFVFVNSLTVFAYPDVIYQGSEKYVSENDIGRAMEVGEWVFVPDNIDDEHVAHITYYEELNDITLCYDKQFTDDDGNIYPIQSEISIDVYADCAHAYVIGTVTEHTKNEAGGCTATTYSAERCTKCGYILLLKGDFISETIYAICPH